MPRYFFHLKCGNRVVIDEEGINLSDLEHARVNVVESIRQILSETGLEFDEVDGRKLEITNATGQTVLIVPF